MKRIALLTFHSPVPISLPCFLPCWFLPSFICVIHSYTPRKCRLGDKGLASLKRLARLTFHSSVLISLPHITLLLPCFIYHRYWPPPWFLSVSPFPLTLFATPCEDFVHIFASSLSQNDEWLWRVSMCSEILRFLFSSALLVPSHSSNGNSQNRCDLSKQPSFWDWSWFAMRWWRRESFAFLIFSFILFCFLSLLTLLPSSLLRPMRGKHHFEVMAGQLRDQIRPRAPDTLAPRFPSHPISH